MKLSLGLGLGVAASAGLSYYAVKKYRQSAASLAPDAVVPQIKAKVSQVVESARGYLAEQTQELKGLAHETVEGATAQAHSLINKAEPAAPGQSLIQKSL